MTAARDLPAMDALRAFACVARTLSMKDAAAELHLSPSALSHRIQSLEEHLGTPLLRRLNPGLELTPAGVRYREVVDAALTQLSGAQDELSARRGPLRISALASFSESWLIPHLPEFEQAHGTMRQCRKLCSCQQLFKFGFAPRDCHVPSPKMVFVTIR